MRIHCKLCPKEFVSLVVPQQQAMEELSNNLAQHCATKHIPEIEKLNIEGTQAGARMMWYMLVTRFGALDRTEEFFLGQIEEQRKAIIKIVGLEEKEEVKV